MSTNTPATQQETGASSSSQQAEMLTFSCAICNSKSAKLCSTCKNTAYCGKDCQEADWPCHKLLCAELGENSKLEYTLPESSIRAVLLPADSDKPVIVYLPFVRDLFEGLDETVATLFLKHEKPEIAEEVYRFLERTEGELSLNPLDHVDVNKVRKYRATENILEIWQHSYPGSATNRAVIKATGGKGRHHVWRGSVLVAAISWRRDHPHHRQVYKDLSLRDFRDAVDWLADYGNPKRERDELASLLPLILQRNDEADTHPERFSPAERQKRADELDWLEDMIRSGL